MSGAQGETAFVIQQVGRLGNHMFQLMFARAVQQHARRRVVISGYDMPAWGLSAPATAPLPAHTPRIGGHLLEARRVAAAIDALGIRAVRMNNLCLRVSSLLEPSAYSDIFPLKGGRDLPDDALVIHVRAGDIVKDVHPSYGPLPFSYYRALIRETGLRPFFVGEIFTEPYASALRAAFPTAEFVGGETVIDDFQTLRRARNLALSVSTFGWLAAYFSEAQAIHVPVAGFLDPLDQPDKDTLILDDPRYRYRFIPAAIWAARFADFEGASVTDYRAASRAELIERRGQARRQMTVARVKCDLGLWARGGYHLMRGGRGLSRAQSA
jgi:hypothetical protein